MLGYLLLTASLTGSLWLAHWLLAASGSGPELVEVYESGYSPVLATARAPFALGFYKVGLAFLLLDLEVALLLPLLSAVGLYAHSLGFAFFAALTAAWLLEVTSGTLDRPHPHA